MAKQLCILVHGFTGSPAEVEPLAEALLELGYDVEVPVLFGHGGTKEDLRRATSTTWLNSVRPIVEDGLKTHDKVHLIGFSMGAMISAMVAERLQVSSLTMLAPAIYYTSLKQIYRQTANLIKKAWPTHGKGQGAEYVRDRMDKISQVPLQAVRQFRRMVQMAKVVLPKLDLPICIIQGELDDIVEPRGAAFVYNSIASEQKEVHYLPESGHVICCDTDQRAVIEMVTAFLDKVNAGAEMVDESDFVDDENIEVQIDAVAVPDLVGVAVGGGSQGGAVKSARSRKTSPANILDDDTGRETAVTTMVPSGDEGSSASPTVKKTKKPSKPRQRRVERNELQAAEAEQAVTTETTEATEVAAATEESVNVAQAAETKPRRRRRRE